MGYSVNPRAWIARDVAQKAKEVVKREVNAGVLPSEFIGAADRRRDQGLRISYLTPELGEALHDLCDKIQGKMP
jgi:hypothetical protein